MLSSLAQLTSIKLSFSVPTGERGRGGGGERERKFSKKKKKKDRNRSKIILSSR